MRRAFWYNEASRGRRRRTRAGDCRAVVAESYRGRAKRRTVALAEQLREARLAIAHRRRHGIDHPLEP